MGARNLYSRTGDTTRGKTDIPLATKEGPVYFAELLTEHNKVRFGINGELRFQAV